MTAVKHNILLGDPFSLSEDGYFGRSIANRSLLKVLFLCDRIGHIITTTPEKYFQRLGLPEVVGNKLVYIKSLTELTGAVHEHSLSAIFCSDYVAVYSSWIDFRNRLKLNCPVFGWTHSLSYQRYTADIYKILTAGPRNYDGVLCTSPSAVTAVSNQLNLVSGSLNKVPQGPVRYLLPLAFEPLATETAFIGKPAEPFQVLTMGRLDWQTKSDLLVLENVIRQLPDPGRIRFVVAGGGDNQGYINLLRQILGPLQVEIRINISDAEKEKLYRESHLLFLPSDNYQETFGLVLLEAKRHGCVPLVSNFDGFRSLVTDGVDGELLETYAAPIPGHLQHVQTIVSEAIYHGWWAAGVSIDPRQAALKIQSLHQDRTQWQRLSSAAIQTVHDFSPEAVAIRLGNLLDGRIKPESEAIYPKTNNAYPGNWNMLEIFNEHPSQVWSDQKVELTTAGRLYQSNPQVLPQMALLFKAVTPGMISRLLEQVGQGLPVREIVASGSAPICLSLALKNGLICIG